MKTKADKQETVQTPIKLYNTKQVAELWGLSYWKVRDLVLDGKIKPIVGLSKGWLFDSFELKQEHLERL